MMWNRGVPILERKKSSAGKAARRTLVAMRFGDQAFDRIRRRHAKTAVSDDDINDAFAALWTAERIANGEAVVIPTQTQRDGAGLRMEISY
jgi:predicted RNase H-like nuclease